MFDFLFLFAFKWTEQKMMMDLLLSINSKVFGLLWMMLFCNCISEFLNIVRDGCATIFVFISVSIHSFNPCTNNRKGGP